MVFLRQFLFVAGKGGISGQRVGGGGEQGLGGGGGGAAPREPLGLTRRRRRRRRHCRRCCRQLILGAGASAAWRWAGVEPRRRGWAAAGDR